MRMTRLTTWIGILTVAALLATPAAATTQTYMLTDAWGGTWADAEKSPANNQDDLMCWAGAAANVLEWTGWGKTAGMTNADEMFTYFQDHWTDAGGNMAYGWDWWFDGTNETQGVSGWSQVDVPGGGFYPTVNFGDYFHYDGTNAEADALADIDPYLRSGYGVGLAIVVETSSGLSGHAVTCWRFDYNDALAPTDPGYYTGIWITDSDDDKYDSTPEDELRHYGLTWTSGAWHLENYFGDYRIVEVQGLDQRPVPEPITMAGLTIGVGSLVRYVRRRCG